MTIIAAPKMGWDDASQIDCVTVYSTRFSDFEHGSVGLIMRSPNMNEARWPECSQGKKFHWKWHCDVRTDALGPMCGHQLLCDCGYGLLVAHQVFDLVDRAKAIRLLEMAHRQVMRLRIEDVPWLMTFYLDYPIQFPGRYDSVTGMGRIEPTAFVPLWRKRWRGKRRSW